MQQEVAQFGKVWFRMAAENIHWLRSWNMNRCHTWIYSIGFEHFKCYCKCSEDVGRWLDNQQHATVEGPASRTATPWHVRTTQRCISFARFSECWRLTLKCNETLSQTEWLWHRPQLLYSTFTYIELIWRQLEGVKIGYGVALSHRFSRKFLPRCRSAENMRRQQEVTSILFDIHINHQ
jgi:hypothetical protein